MKQKTSIILILLLVSAVCFARKTYNFNSNWTVMPPENEEGLNLLKGKIQKAKTVTLPYAWNEDEAYAISTYETSTAVVWYEKSFTMPETAKGKKVFIEFEGARQAAEVWLNDKRIGLSENGIMAFGFDLTPYIKEGKNIIRVRTDNDFNYKEQTTGSRWQWQSRAFNVGYGGLTKNVWLHVMENVYQTLPLMSDLGTTGVYIYAKDFNIKGHSATIHAESEVRNDSDSPVTRNYMVVIEEMNGKEIARFKGESKTIMPHSSVVLSAEQNVEGLHFWSWGYGYLYRVKTIIDGDEVTTITGFRKTEFKNGMIYLNDRVIMIHGYAQRSTNEWPGVGTSVPAWLSDYSNDLFVKSGGNIVRWMHTAPWRQDVESCDRVGLLQAMPAGDAEKDVVGRWWTQRKEVMRDAIVYFRNNPSIIFYECGNQRITGQHMREMKAIRNLYDPFGGRAIGCREMLDQPDAEYGGEMLYINKSDSKPMWMMEYCRDEAHRWYWNSWSYPFHKEGDGPLYRNGKATAYNHNNDEFVVECVRRWHEYYTERPGSGTKVNSGGVKIVFSDTQSHGRSADNYRVSGVVDPMRIEKDAFFAHQVMWNAWVDDFIPQTYIVGHWNYERGFRVPTIYVVSNADSVALFQDKKPIKADSHQYRFLWTFKNVEYTTNKLVAVGYDMHGNEHSKDEKFTAGKPHHLKLTPIENPTGWKADGNDLVLVQVEVVDEYGRRCPLDNRLIKWSIKGPAQWRGGIAKTKPYSLVTNSAVTGSKEYNPLGIDKKTLQHLNHVLQDTLQVECGVSRVMLRSSNRAGKVLLTARAEGLPKAEIELTSKAVRVEGGLSEYMPADGLPMRLDRGETPITPSFKKWREEVPIMDAVAGSGDPILCYDTHENTSWESKDGLDNAWITFMLAEKTKIDDVCMKMKNFRSISYPIAVYADSVEVWRGWTPKGLGFIHIPLNSAPSARTYILRMIGKSTKEEAFGMIKELDARNDEKTSKGGTSLRIVEVEFLRNIK